MGKKIIVLNGSPRSRGNTAALIREFANGAEAAGGVLKAGDIEGKTVLEDARSFGASIA